MMGLDRSKTGELVVLFAGAGSLPLPATKADDTAGKKLTGTAALRPNNIGSIKHQIVLENDTAETITDVQLMVFDRGMWRFLAVPVGGTVIFPLLAMLAGFPIQFEIENLGSPERILVTAGNISGLMNGWIQAIEER